MYRSAHHLTANMKSPPDQAPLPANATATIGGIQPKAASTATIEVNGERLDIRILESNRDWDSWYGWLSDLFVDRNCWSLLHADEHILEKHRRPLPLLASRNERNEYLRLCDAYDEQQIRLVWAKDVFRASLSSEIRLETARLGFCCLKCAIDYLDRKYNPASRNPLPSTRRLASYFSSRRNLGWPYRSHCGRRCSRYCQHCDCRACSIRPIRIRSF